MVFIFLPNVQDEPCRFSGIGSGVFHEKACRDLYLKRFTFFRRERGPKSLPDGQTSIRTRGGDVNVTGAGGSP